MDKFVWSRVFLSALIIGLIIWSVYALPQGCRPSEDTGEPEAIFYQREEAAGNPSPIPPEPSSNAPSTPLAIQATDTPIATVISITTAHVTPSPSATAQSSDDVAPAETAVYLYPRSDAVDVISLHALLPRMTTLVTVRDALTGQPIEGATLITDRSPRLTDAEGKASFIALPAGQRIVAYEPNHEPAQYIYAGEDQLTLELKPKSVLLHIVDAETGQPIPGVHLRSGDVEWKPEADGLHYHINEWMPEQPFSVRAAGYQRHTFLLDRASLRQHRDPQVLSLVVSEASTGQMPALELCVPRFIVKGLYIPFGLLTLPDRVQSLLKLVQETELNAVVIDMKGDRGHLGFQSQEPLAKEFGVLRKDVLDIQALLAQCKELGIYTIARQVVFKDHPLATSKPKWAVRTITDTIWLDREGLGWGNPFLQEVRDYNIALAKEIAALGFDEIQFDYLRFPSDGDVSLIFYEQENTLASRSEAIKTFMAQVTAALRPYDIFISADVFGLTVWVPPEEDMGIGQRVMDIAPYVDYLCPMVYPFTFGPGNLGYESPAEHPYEVVYRSVVQAHTRVLASTKVRPWLQAYRYTLNEYLLQKQAATDAASWGWCFWNASGKYFPELFEKE